MKKSVLCLLLVTTLVGLPSALAGDDWEVLGKREVKNRAERDVIEVTRKEGIFTKVKIKVKRRTVEFFDVKIHFANGDVQDVSLRSTIRPGNATRVIDLPGNKRTIKKVTFVYKTKGPGKKRAVVSLLGR